MAILFERTIRHRNTEYRVKVELDDEAIMDNIIRVNVLAGVRGLPDGQWVDDNVDLVADFSLSVVQVVVKGQVIATVPLELPLDDIVDFLGNDIDIFADDGVIEQAIGVSGIEGLIHLIPTDPFLGCIVKSAISTTIGQIIRCWRAAPKEDSVSQLVRDIGSCLQEHGLPMTFTFLFRAGRCAVFAGLS